MNNTQLRESTLTTFLLGDKKFQEVDTNGFFKSALWKYIPIGGQMLYNANENQSENLTEGYTSITLDDLNDINALNKKYCDLNYKKLSEKSLTEAERTLMKEIEDQCKDQPVSFSNDPDYLAAKKEIKQLRGKTCLKIII